MRISRAGPRYRLHSRLGSGSINKAIFKHLFLCFSFTQRFSIPFHTYGRTTTLRRIQSLNSTHFIIQPVASLTLVRWSSRPRAHHVFELSCHNAAAPGTFRRPRNFSFGPRCTAVAAPRGYCCSATGRQPYVFSLGLVLHFMPCLTIATPHHLADHHAPQSSTSSYLRLWTGVPINTFGVSCFPLANMFLACYGRSSCLRRLLLAPF